MEGLYKMIVEAIMIASLILFILMFCIVLELLPGNSYKLKKYNFQLGLSAGSLILCLAVYIIVKLMPDYALEVNKMLSADTIIGFIVIYAIFFVCSIYRYYDIKKNNEILINIQLKKEEYKLSEDFDLLLGNSFVLMPNVTKYAVSNNITIVFTSVVPETEIDAIFVCKSIGENTYECISIDRLDNYNVKSIISYISAIMIAFLALVESFLLVIGFHNFDNTNINNVLLGIFGGIGLVFLGGVAIKLFKNVEGITKYIFIIFGCFMIFIGIAKLFIMF